MKRLKNFLLRALWQDPNYEIDQMNCPEIIIVGIEQPMYDKLLAEANAAGAVFNGDKVAFKGCEFDWQYDSPSQILHVTCISKPFYVTCDYIKSKIKELAEDAKAGI